MKSTYTRDVNPAMIAKCKDENVFGKFIDFVKIAEDLAVCFRGNDSDMGTVTIYRHNHMMWQLKIDSGSPVIGISVNHCRFMSDWDTYAIKGLMDLGFTPAKKGYENYNYEMLKREKALAFHNGKNNYNAIPLEYRIGDETTPEMIQQLIEKSYVILCRMQNEYFEPLKANMVKVKYKKHEKNQPINFIKAYCEGIDCVERKTYVDNEQVLKIYANPQSCTEKRVQQEIFTMNHKLKDGLFVYDLEFAQPQKIGVKLGESNKPDMFAVRFDAKGNMRVISLVEVKSTETAFIGTSGAKKHMKGMLEYINYKTEEGLLIDDRKKEACRILNQYRELGLYGLSEDIPQFEEADFLKLEIEIIFVFSHGFTLETKISKKQKVEEMISEAIAEQVNYKVIMSENYSGKITYGDESRCVSAYRYSISKK